MAAGVVAGTMRGDRHWDARDLYTSADGPGGQRCPHLKASRGTRPGGFDTNLLKTGGDIVEDPLAVIEFAAHSPRSRERSKGYPVFTLGDISMNSC